MGKTDNTLRNGIIATVVGGIILVVLQWMYGLLGTALKMIKSIILSIINFMAIKVYISIWVLIVISAVAIILIMAILKILISKHKTTNSYSGEPQPISYYDLDQLQKDILRQLASHDGGPLGIDDLYYQIQINRLRIGEAIERLEEHGLVAQRPHVLYGTKFGLTRGGRDLLMKEGLI